MGEIQRSVRTSWLERAMKDPENSMPQSVADLAGLGKLWDEQRPKLLAMVQRRLDPALAARLDAEDILNNTFFAARVKWSRFKQQSSITAYAWLYRITLDCLIEAWRRTTRDCRDPRAEMPFPEHSSVQLGLGLLTTGTSPSAAAVREELQQQVQQIVALLKEADRKILWMRHYDD